MGLPQLILAHIQIDGDGVFLGWGEEKKWWISEFAGMDLALPQQIQMHEKGWGNERWSHWEVGQVNLALDMPVVRWSKRDSVIIKSDVRYDRWLDAGMDLALPQQIQDNGTSKSGFRYERWLDAGIDLALPQQTQAHEKGGQYWTLDFALWRRGTCCETGRVT